MGWEKLQNTGWKLPGWNEPDLKLDQGSLVGDLGFDGGFFQLAEAVEFIQERGIASCGKLRGNHPGHLGVLFIVH